MCSCSICVKITILPFWKSSLTILADNHQEAQANALGGAKKRRRALAVREAWSSLDSQRHYHGAKELQLCRVSLFLPLFKVCAFVFVSDSPTTSEESPLVAVMVGFGLWSVGWVMETSCMLRERRHRLWFVSLCLRICEFRQLRTVLWDLNP